MRSIHDPDILRALSGLMFAAYDGRVVQTLTQLPDGPVRRITVDQSGCENDSRLIERLTFPRTVMN